MYIYVLIQIIIVFLVYQFLYCETILTVLKFPRTMCQPLHSTSNWPGKYAKHKCSSSPSGPFNSQNLCAENVGLIFMPQITTNVHTLNKLQCINVCMISSKHSQHKPYYPCACKGTTHALVCPQHTAGGSPLGPRCFCSDASISLPKLLHKTHYTQVLTLYPQRTFH